MFVAILSCIWEAFLLNVASTCLLHKQARALTDLVKSENTGALNRILRIGQHSFQFRLEKKLVKLSVEGNFE